MGINFHPQTVEKKTPPRLAGLDVANFLQQVIIVFDLFLLVNCWHPMGRVNQDGEFNLHLDELQNLAFNGV